MHGLQLLLLDEATCRGRIAFLEELATHAEDEFPQLRELHSTEDFAKEIRLLGQLGAIQAVEEGRLDPERLAVLTWDPEALWQAHCVLTGHKTEGSGRGGVGESLNEDHLGDAASESRPSEPNFTSLAQSGRLDELITRLRPWLPVLLQHVGLSEGLAESLLGFIQARTSQMGGRRFRECLSEWLEEFAEGQKQGQAVRALRAEDWRLMLERGAACRVLEEERSDEPDWAGDFRRQALRVSVASAQDLLHVGLSKGVAQENDLAAFRRDLLLQIEAQREEAFQLFELN
ncbi:MAG: hypothetical protein ABIP48_18530 [Planctomycetota bacterium]